MYFTLEWRDQASKLNHGTYLVQLMPSLDALIQQIKQHLFLSQLFGIVVAVAVAAAAVVVVVVSLVVVVNILIVAVVIVMSATTFTIYQQNV